MRRLIPLLAALIALPAFALEVQVANHSRPTLCAEEDNVDLRLSGPARRFDIQALHPPYIGTLVEDNYAPDFTDCSFKAEATSGPEPLRMTIYEGQGWQLVGHRFAKFWRPADVPVKIGAQEWHDLQLLQLWTRVDERAEEVLVLYPQDGYWRARPLPPKRLGWTAYGTSFLVGPVEEDGRPFVDLKAIHFDPETRKFTLEFRRGGSGTLALKDLTREKIALEVGFASELPLGLPFAALRSMFVTSANADASTVFTRIGQEWHEAPVMGFKGAGAEALTLGRLIPSRHNTSAPDMLLQGFK
ncbi:hypothetical protein ACFSM5_13190 [Lacibacterium aquatile]|uniref:Uncharacterized protein n=1 Tax=Lacibacterium aquatile TaxID=1168082 RepID=A0ABW5DTL7_9PROT